ncbi:MAG: hypothetical protein H6577_01355 [Lewinellaceae bacterium]|nr:hypothetical protein [Saprospiraceae bacterium]MCB9336752.1 hypothetical protein [Lewinellaceae bacterium]
MENTKLKILLQALSKKEFKYLRWFLQSDFFNTDANLLLLYEALAKHHPEFESAALAKERLFSKVFPSIAFNDAKWRNLTLKMKKAVEEYLVVCEVKNEQITWRKLLLNSYKNRNLYALYKKEFEEILAVLENSAVQNIESLREKMQLQKEYYYHPLTQKIKSFSHLQSAREALEILFEAEQSRMACDEIVLKTARTMKSVRQSGTVPKVEIYPYLPLYKSIFELLDNGAEESFQNARLYFLENISRFCKEDKQFALFHLINYTVNQINKGKGEYRRNLLDIYKIGLGENILFENGFLTSGTFNNIASTGAALKEFDWTMDFITEYEQYLYPATKETTKSLALSNLYFQQKQYAKTIEILIQFNSADFDNMLIAKTLLLRSYFELFLKDRTYDELLHTFALSFIRFIKRKNISINKMKRYFAFINVIKEITKSIEAGQWDKSRKEAVTKEIAQNNNMIAKPWLLEKINEL